jgi:hypothetical protein
MISWCSRILNGKSELLQGSCLYPNDLEIQDCACREVTAFKGLGIERLRLLGSRVAALLGRTAWKRSQAITSERCSHG